jgi:hypothetical protein
MEFDKTFGWAFPLVFWLIREWKNERIVVVVSRMWRVPRRTEHWNPSTRLAQILTQSQTGDVYRIHTHTHTHKEEKREDEKEAVRGCVREWANAGDLFLFATCSSPTDCPRIHPDTRKWWREGNDNNIFTLEVAALDPSSSSFRSSLRIKRLTSG